MDGSLCLRDGEAGIHASSTTTYNLSFRKQSSPQRHFINILNTLPSIPFPLFDVSLPFLGPCIPALSLNQCVPSQYSLWIHLFNPTFNPTLVLLPTPHPISP